MPHPTIKTVHIEENQHEACLSPAQKTFNRLIEKIDAQKQLLASWQETIPQYQQEFARKLMPLRHAFCEHQAEMVAMLDTLYTHEKFSHIQYEKISSLITNLCEELIHHHGRDDLKPLYDYHSCRNFDEAAQENNEMLTSILEQEFGIEVDDDAFDFSDPEVMSAKKRRTDQQHDQESRAQRKKTAKQLNKEAREKEEETNISKTIQAVYRQLVAALHPDREFDPAERARKTELMQEVTVAYGKGDLTQLLELQFSIEQIDQHTLRNIADDRLKHYNAILQRQWEELRQELLQIEQHIREMTGLSRHEPLSPKRLFVLLNEDARTMRSQINRIQYDLMRFNDIQQFKSWLKGYRIPESEFDRFF